jgi:thiosulfate dehydrogenase
MMDPADFADLALFVSKGQLDMDQYIDRSTGDAKGDAATGEPLYATLCAGCHGFDGMLIKGVVLGKEAQSNPWEVMHKMLNGQPAEVMPPQRAVDRQQPVDILAYLRTLPTKK